jgi:hypothetical protein
MLPPDCTLVTACYNLTGYNNKCRDITQLLDNMVSLLETPCYLVIFTDNYMYEVIKNKRNGFGLSHLTKYVVREFEELNVYKYVNIVKSNREKYHPTRDERTCAESHLICSSKFDFVLEIINTNPFNTSKFGWIDSNIGKNFSKVCINYKNNMLLNVLNNATDKFHLQVLNVSNKKYIQPENYREYYSQYRWIVCGCLFLTGKEIGIKILNELNNVFIKTTNEGYGHGEEMFYLEILDKYYNDIEKSYGDYKDIINNFITINTSVDYIYFLIIRNYLSNNYHNECYDCCQKVLKSYERYEIEINYHLYFNVLFASYISAFYVNKDVAKEIANKITNLKEMNPYIKNEYEKNKDYHDSQLQLILQ